MGIPNAAFRAGDLYIEYRFESVLFRYEHATERFYRRFYGDSGERRVPHDNGLLNDGILSGVLTTRERYDRGGAPETDPAAADFSRAAVTVQRVRPYWIDLMHDRDHTRSAFVEVGKDGRLEVVTAVDAVREALEAAVAELDASPRIEVTCADGTPVTVERESPDGDLGLRMALASRGFTVVAETSYYRGRSPS
jgi:hypothetical protein